MQLLSWAVAPVGVAQSIPSLSLQLLQFVVATVILRYVTYVTSQRNMDV